MNRESERAAFESLKGAWQSMPPFDVFCAGWRAARAASANETGAEGELIERLKLLLSGDAAFCRTSVARSAIERAIAILSRAPAQAAEPMPAPAGWKLVPVAPTFEMCRAMEEAIDAGWKDSIVWARGIAAAPQPPAQADAQSDKG